jgi:transposase InsO family protein
LIFVWLSRIFPSLRDAITIVEPETVVRWHRLGFRLYWRWKSRSRGGRPRVPPELRRLIREMSLANPLWGASRIHGELLKLGFELAQSTVAKYMAKGRRGPAQTWRTFLRNHAAGIAAMDFVIVPTVGFRLLFALVILRHERRRLISLRVTAHPTAEWIARQIDDAFPWGEAPDYLIRDRDASYGHAVTQRLNAMGIRDRPTAPRSPWQNGHAERLIGSIRRECLDHVVVFGETHLRRILAAYAAYYNDARTHLSLAKDAPNHRPIQHFGRITAPPILGGLHHRYCRI